MQPLFSEFSPTSVNQWKEKLAKDLKGIDFNQLTWQSDTGISIQPFYTKEDLPTQVQPVFYHNDWNIGVKIQVENELQANKKALEALNGGASALCFYLTKATNLTQLLKDIQIEFIATQFYVTQPIQEFINQLSKFITEKELDTKKLDLSINYDVLARFAQTGNWTQNKSDDYNAIKQVSQVPFNRYQLLIDASLYQNTGAHQVTELALILSHYNEYLQYFNEQGGDFSYIKKGIQIHVAIGTDFFTEIAKLRALRKLITFLHTTYNIQAPISISCTTSQVTLSPKDEHTNLLRSTTQAMSSVIGGCDYLYIEPFNLLSKSDETSLATRMARNQQIILKEESYLNKTTDIGAGSYYIENLTEQLATRAFEQFKTYEAKGGFIAALEQNIIQQEVEQQQERLIEKAQKGELIIIGVNKYLNPNSKTSPQSVTTQKTSKSLIKPLKVLSLATHLETVQPVTK